MRSLAVLLAVACSVEGCKGKSAPPSAGADASTVGDAGTDEGGKAATARPLGDAGGNPAPGGPATIRVEDAAVSSRVDNATEQPVFLGDGDLDTAWSSKTGDLEGAWVELRVRGEGAMQAVHMTVGMTKKPETYAGPDLFTQNPRIVEVGITWAPLLRLLGGQEKVGDKTTLVERFTLDAESRELQKIPFDAETRGPGVLRVTVKKVKLGTKPSWREVSISEMAVQNGPYRLAVDTKRVTVGALDPKPRGVLGIVPERRAPFGCLAWSPSVPRVYCVLGYTAFVGSYRANAGELVAIERSGVKRLGALFEADAYDHQIPYGAWLRAERELKGEGRTLESAPDVKSIPWNDSVVVSGVTFRQRETTRTPADADADIFDSINGVLEVRWPGETAFTALFAAFPTPPTQRMVATLRPLGALWLVERRMVHGSEGSSAEGADASLCDFAAKKCTAYTAPEPASTPEPR